MDTIVTPPRETSDWPYTYKWPTVRDLITQLEKLDPDAVLVIGDDVLVWQPIVVADVKVRVKPAMFGDCGSMLCDRVKGPKGQVEAYLVDSAKFAVVEEPS